MSTIPRTAEPGRRRHGDDHLIHLMLAHQLRDRLTVPQHPYALDQHAVLVRIVVHESDRHQAGLRVGPQLAQDQRAGLAGARDQHALLSTSGAYAGLR